jgi:serine/threonine-protein kinase HipA
LDAAIFNVIIGNADAHGKNFSLLYQGTATSLAPLYDLICTAAYEDLATRFAMNIGKSRTIDEIDSNAWSTFATDAEFTSGYVLKRVGTLSELTQRAIPQVVARFVEEGLNREALDRYASLVTARSIRIAKTA